MPLSGKPQSTFEKIDFSQKPEKYLREMVDFLKQERYIEDKDLGITDSKMRSISSHTAKMILQSLIRSVAPNLQQEIKVEQKEIQAFFALLEYPYTIRSDAITAVGAPSTVGFLMRALYWLYLSVKMLYFNPSWY